MSKCLVQFDFSGMPASYSAAKSSIAELPLDNIRARIVKEQSVPSEDVDLAIDEYRKFLFLIAIGNRNLAMCSKSVDEVWHNHILFTKDYHEFSTRVYGGYLHHQPNLEKLQVAGGPKPRCGMDDDCGDGCGPECSPQCGASKVVRKSHVDGQKGHTLLASHKCDQCEACTSGCEKSCHVPGSRQAVADSQQGGVAHFKKAYEDVFGEVPAIWGLSLGEVHGRCITNPPICKECVQCEGVCGGKCVNQLDEVS